MKSALLVQGPQTQPVLSIESQRLEVLCEDVLALQVEPELGGGSRNDGGVLQPLGHHKVLQLLEVLLVLRVLLLPLVVDVCEVVGPLQELLVVEGVVPVLGWRDEV